MGPVMGVKNFSKLPPEFYSFHISNLVSRKLPPHYPQTIEADKTHKWYNYWLPRIGSGNNLKSAKYQLLPKCWTKNLSSTGRMMPKFIVTIGDLLPPTIVLFSHSRTMPDCLPLHTVIISSQTKIQRRFNVRRCTLLSDMIIGSGVEVVVESS